MTAAMTVSRPVPRAAQAWVHRGCALLVAGVAAYSSYAHQRQFALDGGADPVAAALWPLSVDGLVVLASTGLLTQHAGTTRRARWAMRLAFLLGVAVSLAANIAAAPALTWQPIVVAGWPPLALLLAVDLVLHSRRRDRPEHVRASEAPTETDSRQQADHDLGDGQAAPLPATAEELMWAHYERESASGRVPTGADLDRVAGTNNYGRAVLARWRRTGRIPAQQNGSVPAAGRVP